MKPFGILILRLSLLCALASAAGASVSAAQLSVRTNYQALVLYYNPHVVRNGSPIRANEAYNYRDIGQLCREYISFLRKASGGQVNFSISYRYDLDEFPPDNDPAVTFTPENYDQYRSQGYDIGAHGMADYLAICRDPRFDIVTKVEAREVDAVWIFAPEMTGFWETAMAGNGAYWVNGAPYPQVNCSRKFVLFGFGSAAHQGVGFMLENTAHMIENIMHNEIANTWPARHLVTGWSTMDLSNPARTEVQRRLNDWDLFTATDSVHWDINLVTPGRSQAGLSHFPPTACVNYGWSAPRFNFDVHWEAENFQAYAGSWWIGAGVYSCSGGSGLVICKGSHDMRDTRGDYRVPIIVTDADIDAGVRLDSSAASGHAGLVLRAANYVEGTNKWDGYYLGLNPSAARIELARVTNSYTVIASSPLRVESGTNHELFVSMRGDQLEVRLSRKQPPVLIYKGLERMDGAVGLATYDARASFSHLHIVPVITNYAETWRTYPQLGTQAQTVSPRDWEGDDKPYGDMDFWYAWWYEHLPKNPGTHEVRSFPSGQLLGKALNSWWPYLFDINRFVTGTLPMDSEVKSAPADTSPPEPVTNLLATFSGSSKIRVEWAEPQDNVGVTRYEVYRDGKLIRRTPLKYIEDDTAPKGQDHEYHLKAYDGSGNGSAPSRKVRPEGPATGTVINGGFEAGTDAPFSWGSELKEGTAEVLWASTGEGRNGGRCVVLRATGPANVRWTQTIKGLTPKGQYILSAWIRGEQLECAEPNHCPAHVGPAWACAHSMPCLRGTFDWTPVSVVVQADTDGQLSICCRLGDWGRNASGRVWFDDIAISPAPPVYELAWLWGLDLCGCCLFPAALAASSAVAAGDNFLMARQTNGAVAVWGSNCSGQWLVPEHLTNAVAIAAGADHCLALRADGKVVAWGENLYGQAQVPAGIADALGIAAGTRFSLAVMADGSVTAWGSNDRGELNIPPDVGNVVAVDAGHEFALALRRDGTVAAWGYFLFRDEVMKPAYVPAGLSNVMSIACGTHHAVALKCDGTVVCWGESPEGPLEVPAGLVRVKAIAAGGSHCLALLRDNSVVAWGSNPHGQTTVPAGVTNVVAIAAGSHFSFALGGHIPLSDRRPVKHARIAPGEFQVVASCRPAVPVFLLQTEQLYPPKWTVADAALTLQQDVTLKVPIDPAKARFFVVVSSPPN